MQSVPEGLDLLAVRKELEKIDDIANIHHVHAWNLTDSQVHFECHVDLCDNIHISESELIRKKIIKILGDQFSIDHFTIQFEYNFCHDKNMIFNGKH